MSKLPAILTDTTLCTGCEKCVAACKRENDLGKDRPWRGQEAVDDLSSTRFCTILRRPGDRFVRQQCRHCLEPACVCACLVGALQKTPEGPVIYDRDSAWAAATAWWPVPYGIPRYDWDQAVPYVRKCTCATSGSRRARAVPACVEACPEKATIFGDRDELLEEAHRRLEAETPSSTCSRSTARPRWAERRSSTSPTSRSTSSAGSRTWATSRLPDRTWAALTKVPPIVLGMGGLMAGVYWIIGRRMKLAARGELRRAAHPGSAEGDRVGRQQRKTTGKTMTNRLSVLKTILWASVGVLAVVTVVRFTRGLGAVTNLSDAAPWGLWIAFDVMAGVALAAGGFVLAATVYIFGLEQYRPFVRPAILTALLGYVAVAVGLLYDLGLPWHIWHPIIYPQHHSVLFEVAMCVMLYLTVLSLEFAPVVLEHPLFARAAVSEDPPGHQEDDDPPGDRGNRAVDPAPVVARIAVPDHAVPAASALVLPII